MRPQHDGVADAIARLAAALTDEGAGVRILHVGASDVRGAHCVGRAWGPAALLRAGRLLRGADVVHVQFAPSMYRFSGWIGLLPLLLGRTPLVTTVHEYGWWSVAPRVPGVVWTGLEQLGAADRETALLVPRSTVLIATNEVHEREVRRRFPALRVTRIPIGSNVRTVQLRRSSGRPDDLRRRLDLPVGAAVVAFFGFVHPVKGLRYLVDAIASLRAEGRAVHLQVLGGFESMALPADEAAAFESELRAHIDAAGMAAHTTITGWLPETEIGERLTVSDLAALPFTAGVTAKSGSLLAVLGHRLPTLVTAPAEPEPELVDGEQCVVVSPVRDADAIASGLRRLLDEPGLAATVAEGGLALARSRRWDRIAQAHLEVYDAARRARP